MEGLRSFQFPIKETGDNNSSTPTQPRPDPYFSSLSFKGETLSTLWKTTDDAFFKKTNLHLSRTSSLHKEGLLQKWRTKCAERSESLERFNKIEPILSKIASCVELVGAFAAPAIAPVFPLAQLCFNALGFLIDIPMRVYHILESLEDLLKEILNSLVKFKILDRIDQSGQLDADLVENARELLEALSTICLLAVRLLLKRTRRVEIALMVVFLTKEDEIIQALKDFQRLAVSQAHIEGALALEHILKNEALCGRILAAQQAETMKAVDISRQAELEHGLFLKSDHDKIMPAQPKQDLLEALEAFMATSQYKLWSTVDDAGISELYLEGLPGTGKTHVIDALREYLETKRRSAPKQGPRTYVAHHSFADRLANAGGDDRRENVPLIQALKRITLQLARQNTDFAAMLCEKIQYSTKLAIEDDIEKVWTMLGLLKFKTPPNSELYLIFHGLSGESGDRVRNTLYKYFSQTGNSVPTNNRSVIRILYSGDSKATKNIPFLQQVDMLQVNEMPLKKYIDHQLEINEILQESDQKTRKQRRIASEALVRSAAGNFQVVKQKLKQIREAIEKDATSAEIKSLIEQDAKGTVDDAAQQRLILTAQHLSEKHLLQLNRILMWTLHGVKSNDMWTLSQLESMLQLQDPEGSLESLAKKIKKRFHKVIKHDPESDEVHIQHIVERYLKQIENDPIEQVAADERLFSMTITFKNAKKAEVRKILRDLDAELASDTSFFSEESTTRLAARIHISRLQSLVEITQLCLTLLNDEDGWRRNPFAYKYACYWLPKHFSQLHLLQKQVLPDQRKLIGEELISFLSEPYSLEHGQGKFSIKTLWVSDVEDADNLDAWLNENEAYLTSQRKRWLKQVPRRSDGRPDHLYNIARAIARRWRRACNELEREWALDCCLWLYAYKTWLNTPLDGKIDLKNGHASEASVELPPPEFTTGEIALLGPTSEPVSSPKVMICQTANWVLKILPDIEEAEYHYNTGICLLQARELDEAVTWLNKARTDPHQGWRAMIALAGAQSKEALSSVAVDLLKTARDQARSLQSQNGLNAYEITLFTGALNDLARNLEQSSRTEDAIQQYQEILSLQPKNGRSRLALLRTFCKNGRGDGAQLLLNDWVSQHEFYGGHPTDALCEIAGIEDAIAMLRALLPITYDRKVGIQFLNIIHDAAEIARENSWYSQQAQLLHLLATAYSMPSHEHTQKPEEIWESILDIPQTSGNGSWELSELCTTAIHCASRIKFDELRDRFEPRSASGNISNTDSTIREDLRLYVHRLEVSHSRELGDSYFYVAALSKIMNHDDWARTDLSQSVQESIFILCDSEPANDAWGAYHLMRALCLFGDDVNGRIAFSLLGRRTRVEAIIPRRGSVIINDYTSEELAREKLSTEVIELGRDCDSCGKALSGTGSGFWICRWCPDVDLCDSCFSNFKARTLQYENCNPTHDLLRIYHPEHEREKLSEGNVLVDWQLTYISNGYFTCTGGREVSRNDWLRELTTQWGLRGIVMPT